MSKGPPCTAAIALVLAGGSVAGAQINTSLNRAGSGARAAGMGDAFIAVSDDGTAASWNPAGLAQLRQPEFSLVYGAANRRLRYSGMRSPDDRFAFSGQRYTQTNASLEFASAALPLSIARKPMTLQVGWHRLYQLGSNLTGNVDVVPVSGSTGRARSVWRDDRLTGDIDVFSAAAAVKVSSRLALGGGLDLWRGEWAERFSLAEDPAADGAPAFFASDAGVRVAGHNFTAGLLLTYPAWNVGFVYHSPFSLSYRLRGRARSTLGPEKGIDAPAARFRFPRSMGAGVARRLGSRWTAAASLTHDQWTDALLTGMPGTDGPVNFFDGAPPQFSTTRDTLSLNLGLEHLFLREGSVVPLRIGFGWEPQGAMDPAIRDPVNYLLATAGAGYNTNRFKFDAAVQYRWGSVRLSDTLSVARAFNGSPIPDAVGNATSHEWRIKVSAIYRMPDMEKLRGAIRKIIG